MLSDSAAAKGMLVVLGICLVVTEARAHLTQELLEHLSQSEEGCDVSNIGDVVSCSGPVKIGSDGRHVVAAGEVCLVGKLNIPEKVLRCQENGLWLEEGRYSEFWRGNRHREKRFLGLLIGLIVLSFIGLGIGLAMSEPKIPHNETPTIACPSDITATADEGTTSAQVWWNSPTAKDKEDGVISSKIKQKSGPGRGTRVSEGRQEVQYEVQDSRGTKVYCSFYVTVKVKGCTRLSVPSNGDLKCTAGSIYGSECWLSCHEGFKAAGASRWRCENDGEWSPSGTPACAEIKCPPPPPPANGLYHCPENYRFQTTCHLKCSEGYIPMGTLVIECRKDRSWSSGGRCKDNVPPTFPDCPSDLTAIAEPGEISAVVNWTRPSVRDNSDKARITVENYQPGARFDQGETSVEYRAEDDEKNLATCTFKVKVTVLKCEPPDFDKSQKSLMLIQGCTREFIRGSTCDVSCRSGYPHLGAKSITCEADIYAEPPKVTWKPNDPLDRPPQCKEYPCPALPPPLNGALVCDNWSLGRMCSILCNEKFDVAMSMANGLMFVCGTSNGVWQPHNRVPHCNQKRQPNSYKLSGSVYYFSGHCLSNETTLQIKQQFIQIIQGHNQYRNVCLNNPHCRIEDVSVYCGNTTDTPRSRHGRSLGVEMHPAGPTTPPAPDVEIVVEFVLTLPFTPDYEVKRDETMDAFLEDVVSGSFDLVLDSNDTLKAKDISLGYPDHECPLGSIFNMDSSSCSGCEMGTYFSEAADSCLKCPVGFYGDEGFLLTCKSCPENASTIEDGAMSANSCIPLCEAGQQSLTGLAPCFPCPLGTFQPEPGQRSCLPCPANFSTPSLASTSNSSCLTLLACEEEPCGNHTCHNVLGGYVCSCQGGWSGLHCEIPPDPCYATPCHNNASCVNDGLDFFCTCPEGLFGDLCQYAIVDGGWGAWDSWGACSVFCGGGARSRTRLCDAPPPGPRGQTCNGSASEEGECNLQPCPVCEALEQPRGVTFNCTELANAMLRCTASCRAGLVFAEQPASYYACGPATNFTWSHKLNDSKVRIPACSSVTAPSELNLTTTTRYIPCDVIEKKDKFVTEMTSGTSRLKCARLGLCRHHVTLGGCSQVRGKRSASQNATVEVTLTASMGEEELDFVQFFDNKTMTKGVKRFVDSLVALVTSGEELYNNTDDVLTIEVDGKVFSPEPASVTFAGSQSCSPGKIPVEAFCSPCPEGTKQEGLECILCGRGSYQNLPAQTGCLACPPWTTTRHLGASSVQECVAHCPAGKRQVGQSCEECDRNSYQDQEGQFTCKPCPPGRSSLHPGATALTQCSGCRTLHSAWWTVLMAALFITWYHAM